MTSTIDQQQIDSFLSSLRTNLGPLTLAEREEILREINAHIHDSMELSNLPAATVIAKLGPPEELAADYRDGQLLTRASASFSPVLLLRATLRIATKGISGAFVFFCGLVGYVTGISFILTALLKPFFPERTGVFMAGDHVYRIGIQATIPPSPIHEVFGFWFIPASLAIGSAALIVTTIAIRQCLRLSNNWQKKLTGRSTSSWKAADSVTV
jgi:uncharacterized membrane protein